jgi:DNA phosphorothioation-dependent restriction protein DptG
MRSSTHLKNINPELLLSKNKKNKNKNKNKKQGQRCQGVLADRNVV